MSPGRRLHPERIILVIGGAAVILTWVLGLTGFITGSKRLVAYAGYVFAIGVAVWSLPLLTYLIGLIIEKFRGNRHD